MQAWDTELLVPFLFDDASAAWQERERRSMRAAVAEGYGDGASGTAVADEPLRRAMDSAPPAVRKRLAAQYSGAVENRRAAPPQRTGTQAEPEAEGGVHPEGAPTRRTEGPGADGLSALPAQAQKMVRAVFVCSLAAVCIQADRR